MCPEVTATRKVAHYPLVSPCFLSQALDTQLFEIRFLYRFYFFDAFNPYFGSWNKADFFIRVVIAVLVVLLLKEQCQRYSVGKIGDVGADVEGIDVQDFLFPDKLKLADLGPLPKGDEKTNKKNYRPISLLPALSKIFERIMETQLWSFVNEKLLKYMSGYRKGYNTQYALMVLLEKWKQSLDNHGYAGAVIIDLSKAFDTINHELLIEKLHAYGLTKPALKLLYSYLRNRWHRTKINTSFSTWKELLTGVP